MLSFGNSCQAVLFITGCVISPMVNTEHHFLHCQTYYFTVTVMVTLLCVKTVYNAFNLIVSYLLCWLLSSWVSIFNFTYLVITFITRKYPPPKKDYSNNIVVKNIYVVSSFVFLILPIVNTYSLLYKSSSLKSIQPV